MRRTFVNQLEEIMKKDEEVCLITLDVGYGILESIKEKFPDRFFNFGIGEQNSVSVATGMALKGKKPFVYSINSFLIFRALEQIRMLSDMKQKVVLVGVGIDKEYTNFGISHYSNGDREILATMPIEVISPKNSEETKKAVQIAYEGIRPYYLRLSRYNKI